MKSVYAMFSVIAALIIVLVGGCAAVLYQHSPVYGWIPLALFAVLAVCMLIFVLRFRRICTGWIHRLVKKIDPMQEMALETFPLPLLMIDEQGNLLYSNKLFHTQVMQDSVPVVNTPISKLFEGSSLEKLVSGQPLLLQRGARKYTAFASTIRSEKGQRYVLYLFDDTALKDTAEEYKASRPVVLQICIDNLEEATEHLRAGDRARISGHIETMLEDWISAGGGLLQKYGNERFVCITEHRHLAKMVESRFSILQKVRDAFPEADGSITLSIGIGQEKTIDECRRSAMRALDMALSRGGDQVAVKNINGYDFYGGKSGGVQHRARVRTRIIADALHELISTSDRVYVMGHRMSDLDSLGGSAALASVINRIGVPAYAVVNRQATMAGHLIERFAAMGKDDLFISPESATKSVTKNTLLIIVDTHTATMLESQELFNLTERVVVIDHHRKMVNHIENTVLTYHESASSSASELIAELLPYFSDQKTSRIEAEALLAGIMLDTRNFVLRTGVRTFEAAAYLRSMGADTVTVKKMFAESLELYRRKSDLVAAAEIYHNTAVTVTEEDYTDFRTAAAQAADDLLSVQGVQASFVVSRMKDQIQISARSFGECNVQLIMEALGGGGHLTMAATQLSNCTVAEAEARLKQAISDYFEQQNS
ncbi:MAG: DHH family phosphoesterase [Ruminococcaceae bacterium]|nr:DHH family phosphoesterase [Oscillospiraceae bacterium]